jgi:hypothetical protein
LVAALAYISQSKAATNAALQRSTKVINYVKDGRPWEMTLVDGQRFSALAISKNVLSRYQ